MMALASKVVLVLRSVKVASLLFWGYGLWMLPGIVLSQPPACSYLLDPIPGSTGVSLNSDIRWAPVPNAIHYTLYIGRTPGGKDVVDGVDMGSSLSYTPTSGWEPNTTYYVMILPGNNDGTPPICPEDSFTTGDGDGLPGCVTLKVPVQGAYGIMPGTAISWYPQNIAVGYRISMGTAPGNYDIVQDLDLGPATLYTPPAGLPEMQQIYVRIVPYNVDGDAPACSEYSFRTRGDSPPSCTEFLDPRDGSEFVSVSANITWIREFNASGYRMTIEEQAQGGIKILDNEEVGSGTNYKPPNFKGNTRYFVTIVPYNDLGPAQNCIPISFTTGNAPSPPECTTLRVPEDGSRGVPVSTGLAWDAVANATGYLVSAGTGAGRNDLADQVDVGAANTYGFEKELPGNTRIYVRITPYNTWGAAENCLQWSFLTRGAALATHNLPIPGFFTPNNDGFNDTWIVRSTPGLVVNRIWIFNRVGQLLKYLPEGQSWDGTFNGRPLAADSYWYLIETQDGRTLKGHFLLKR